MCSVTCYGLKISKSVKPEVPVGVAFVTFPKGSIIDDRIRADFAYTPLIMPRNKSSMGSKMDIRWWATNNAPYPNDILWKNLSRKGAQWYFYWFLINLVLLFITLFLTTPSFIVQTIENLNITDPLQDLIEKKSPLVASYIPTLMLWTFSALIPLLVWYAGYWEKHWTISSTHFNIMQKCYGFLLLMVLIMPSLGSGALSLVLERLFSKDHPNEAVNRFECIFLADNGSFFVNYIIFAAFLSCGLELLRIPEFLQLGIRLCLSKTDAEKYNIKKSRTFHFEFGLHLAWMLTIFTVQSSYSLAVPVINVFGFMYLSLKHLVDRYNLYYAYLPSRISKRIVDRAIEITMMAVRMGLMFILFFTLLRYDIASNELVNRPIAVVILTILVLFQFLAFAPEFSKISCLASIFGPISLLKGNKYILSAENTEIDADSYKIDILGSSVSSPYVEEVSNSAGDSPHIDAPL